MKIFISFMLKYTFDYTGNPIMLVAQRKLDSKTADYIHSLIRNLSFDLNHSIYNTSAFVFNETTKGNIANVSRDFIDFLNLNLQMAEKYEGFNPFVFNSENISDNIGKYIQIDFKNNKFVKSENLMLDSSKLRTALILDSIAALLKSKKILDLLLSHNETYRSLGSKVWDIDHEIDSEKISNKITNQTISFKAYSVQNKSQNKNFISMDKPINHRYMVIKGNDGFIENEILHDISDNLFMESDYGNFCLKHKIELTAIDASGKRFNFSPNSLLSI